MSEHWLTLTGEINPEWQKLVARFGGEKIDAMCSGRWYELSHAAIAMALNLAIDKTGLTPRKRKRIGPGMLRVMFNVLPLVFMFGWMARDEAIDATD